MYYLNLKGKTLEPMALLGFRERKWRQSTLDEFCENEKSKLPLAFLCAYNAYPLSNELFTPLLGLKLDKNDRAPSYKERYGHKRRYL